VPPQWALLNYKIGEAIRLKEVVSLGWAISSEEEPTVAITFKWEVKVHIKEIVDFQNSSC